MTPAALHVFPVDGSSDVRFLEVEGDLDESANARWIAALRRVAEDGADALAVDLRGCRTLDRHCLAALLAVAATLRSRGGAGVALVMHPGSSLPHQLPELAGGELSIHPDAHSAVLALAASA